MHTIGARARFRRLLVTVVATMICLVFGFAFDRAGGAATIGTGSARGAGATHPHGSLRVSCPAAHWCAVIDGHDRALEYAHGAFSKPSEVKVAASELACSSRRF